MPLAQAREKLRTHVNRSANPRSRNREVGVERLADGWGVITEIPPRACNALGPGAERAGGRANGCAAPSSDDA